MPGRVGNYAKRIFFVKIKIPFRKICYEVVMLNKYLSYDTKVLDRQTDLK